MADDGGEHYKAGTAVTDNLAVIVGPGVRKGLHPSLAAPKNNSSSLKDKP